MTREEILLALAAGGLKEREQARLEAMLWSTFAPAERSVDGKAIGIRIIASYVGQVPSRVELRHKLHRVDVVELWDEVDRGMPLWTANDILQRAKHRRRLVGRTLREALVEVLGEYVARTKDGGHYKRRAATKKGATTPFARGQAQGRLWGAVKAAVVDYLDGELRGVDPERATQARVEAAAEVDAALLAATRSVARAVAEEAKGPRRARLVEACRVLGLQPPPVGREADLARAKKSMRALVREYHPDARGGDDSARPALEAAVAAYGIVEDYNRSIENKPLGAKQNGATT